MWDITTFNTFSPPVGFDWASIDGSSQAPSGAAQYPNYFTNLNGISPYPFRPPWHVAGVDYRTGINTAIVLKDPATIPSSIATVGGGFGAGQNAHGLDVQNDNVTIDGYDLTLSGGYSVKIDGHTGVTIQNCKMQNLCVFAGTGSGAVTIKYCEIDGLGSSGETTFGTLILLQDGVPLTFQYNWIKNSQSDMIDMTTQDCNAQWNLFDTMGYEAGAHSDSIQFAGNGTANNILIQFNTYVHTATTVSSPSSFIDLETQITTPTMNNPIVAYNTASYTFPGQTIGSTFYRIAQDTGTITGASVHDNWADPTNMIVVISDATPGTGYSKSNNRLLTTGALF